MTIISSQPGIDVVVGRYGELFIPSDSDLIGNSIREYGEWAQHEIDAFKAFIQRDDFVVDAGAYIGTHARAFSTLVGNGGQVYAFEPNATVFNLLQHNAAAATEKNIQLFNIGLGAIKAEASLSIVDADHNRASASTTPIAGAQAIPIKVYPLDDLALPKVNFMKVDVEGMELQLLHGAEHTIRRNLPIVFLEVNSLQGSRGFLDWAAQHDYLAYGLNVAAFNDKNHFNSSVNIFGHAREAGLLLLPTHKVQMYKSSLHSLRLPRIDNLDDLALLLLHKPQYLEDVLGNSSTFQHLGLSIPTQEKQMSIELIAMCAAKDTALTEASQAYAALRQAYDQKESALLQLHETLTQQQKLAKDIALAGASEAYAELKRAYDQKEEALAKLYQTLHSQQQKGADS